MSKLVETFAHFDCAGVDEVGRGPLAGPVMACALIIPRELWRAWQDGHADWLAQVDCSKSLTKTKRKFLAVHLRHHTHFACACACARVIDRINIRQATLLAMRRAIMRLPYPPMRVLIDGRDSPDVPYDCETIIRGDQHRLAIAAASIIAKVARDELMQKLHKRYEPYGWANNSGYGTKQHLHAISDFGITAHHRMSFAPIKNAGI